MRRKITDKLVEWKNRPKHKTLMVFGARQVGKTYIITEFAKEHYDHYVYVNFMGNDEVKSAFNKTLNVDNIITGLSIYDPSFTFVPHRTLIILDEIQDCPRAIAALKPLTMDDRYDIIASGSLLGINMKDVPSYPVGYVEREYLNPMDFEEFLWALGVSEEILAGVKASIRSKEPLAEIVHNKFMEYLRWYMIIGGMPEAVDSYVRERKMDGVLRTQHDILDIYVNDIAKHAAKNQILRTTECLRSIGSQLARDNKKFKYSDIPSQPDDEKSHRYYEYALDWLYNAGVTMKCNNVSGPESPIVEHMDPYFFKLYMADVGLLISTYDSTVRFKVWNNELDVNKGAVTENLIAMMLNAQGRSLHYFKKDLNADGKKDRMKVDFLIETMEGPTAIVVKSGSNRNCRSLNKIIERYGVRGIMFETRNIFVDDKGVEHYPLFAAAFLDEIDPPQEMSFDPDDII